ncbi:MAG: helix-turn-helix domain-containing protein, partial [Chloroflexi bacterium]|nr:helix-turn-helix domain-containing protein [Chloroflexota bacterium]
MGNVYQHLTLEERCKLASLREQGYTKRQIATSLDRSPSTISRELNRNASRKEGYKPVYADEQ